MPYAPYHDDLHETLIATQKSSPPNTSMKPFVRFTILFFAVLFLSGAAFTWFDVLTHENILTNPELRFASGWLMTGLIFLGLGLRGCRWRQRQPEPNDRTTPARPST
jgi:hypothetical protein